MFRTFKYLLFFIPSILTSCQAHLLNVQTQFITKEYLASYRVNTPDHEKECPSLGQRLLIDWRIPAEWLCSPNLILSAKIRFKNRQEVELTIPLQCKKGTYPYELLNDQYLTTGGILTYKVEIKSENDVLESWLHPLWVELIKFNHSD